MITSHKKLKTKQSLAFGCLITLVTLVPITWTFINKVLLDAVDSETTNFISLVRCSNNSITFIKNHTGHIISIPNMLLPHVNVNLGHILHFDGNEVVRIAIWAIHPIIRAKDS